MPVDQNRPAPPLPRRLHLFGQGGMIGRMDPRDSPPRLGQRQAAVVERGSVPRQTRHDAVTGQGFQPRRRPVGTVDDQHRVQVVRRAVQIDIGPPDPPGDQHRPRRPAGRQQTVHGRVLSAAQRRLRQARGRAHVLRIERPRMGRGEHQRRRPHARRGGDAEGRVGRRRAHGLAIA
ncbi:hypothetical protein D3C86_1512980 [compost metagenome]